MPDEITILKQELAEAKARIEYLELNLSNVTLLLKREMTETGKLPDPRDSASAPGRFDLAFGSK